MEQQQRMIPWKQGFFPSLGVQVQTPAHWDIRHQHLVHRAPGQRGADVQSPGKVVALWDKVEFGKSCLESCGMLVNDLVHKWLSQT